MNREPTKYQWTATGMRPSELEYGRRRFVYDYEYDRLKRDYDDLERQLRTLNKLFENRLSEETK